MIRQGSDNLFNLDDRRLNRLAERVINLEESYKNMTDIELKNKTADFKKSLNNGKTLNDILIEAFATVREAAFRTIGLKPYKVQVIGGIVLHEGRIAEMRTGEGKTLTETLPAYLNALLGNGVHIVTVNEYLAERDKNTMLPIFELLGMTCDVILASKSQEEKQKAYNADITYVTNQEAGFDYLRDHLEKEPENRRQRGLPYVIIDEVDSILIDEARTPLIITREKDGTSANHKIADTFVKTLSNLDVEILEKDKFVNLSTSGIEKAENYFGIKNYTQENEFIHYINQSLKAIFIMKKDRDYVVIDGEIVIVDEFTGRLGNGRRFSQGLHQAIEAKENVEIKNETGTLATITYQNLFRAYSKISGMTGTAKTEEGEFREIYGLDVVVIPTNKPLIRKDKPDRIYFKRDSKLRGIIEEIKVSYYKKQPVLVGTTSVERSEELSELLKKEYIPHSLLNAKNHKEEAEIVSKAGQLGQVTIATNMAGRGTDIILGDGVSVIGGLKVIGTERHESRRIDNQLKGRSGRQGDPGESVFFISLEDDLLRLFAKERIDTYLSKQDFNSSEMISNGFFSKQIISAQKRVEGVHFEARKNTIQYDDVLNQQRKIIYEQRNLIMNNHVNIPELLEKYGANTVLPDDFPSYILKHQMLNIIDEEWIQHVDAMMDLKQDAGNASYKGQNPIIVYTLTSKDYFDEMIKAIQLKTVQFAENLALPINNSNNAFVEITA